MENKTVEISVDLIDAPADQQRIDVDVEKLDELRQSIRDHGLINPITVRPVCFDIATGAASVHQNAECDVPAHVRRYELIAGSRRLKVHQLLELPKIKCTVVDVDEKEADLLRAHENEFRHDPNPVESGLYILRLQEKHNMSVAEIAKDLDKSESYVRGRIDLMQYPEYILEHVVSGKLSVGAAHQLAQIKEDDKRRQYVSWAVWRGITAAQASTWRAHAELGAHAQTPEELPSPVENKNNEPYVMRAQCIICRDVAPVMNLGMYYAHVECETALSRGAAEPTPPAAA